MTKHEPIDPPLRYLLEVEEESKSDHGRLKMLENNAFALQDVETVIPQPLTQKRTKSDKAKSDISKLGKVTRRLYDLEPFCQPEKPLKIDLNLYQMEDL